MEPQKQTPLPFLTIDFIKEKLRVAHAVIDRRGDGMQNYTISLGKVYDHWACQLQQDFQGKIFTLQHAYDTLQDQFEEVLTANTILHHELGMARQDAELYRGQLQQYLNVAAEKSIDVVERPDELASENGSTASANESQGKKMRRRRSEQNKTSLKGVNKGSQNIVL
ncbi:hypothetical protein B0J11DRAFT_199735 [Dendryphion nanum]|uniref:Uncharacterized protein n=1 Tax=Dendryphion nanum TaxID=256645 RepID=A0A9P9D1Z1_9PLEO|nr:hypothetical protein B0J11DRAFT_199735 [Dendryphion nanum]